MMSHHLEWKGGSFLSLLHSVVCGFPCVFSRSSSHEKGKSCEFLFGLCCAYWYAWLISNTRHILPSFPWCCPPHIPRSKTNSSSSSKLRIVGTNSLKNGWTYVKNGWNSFNMKPGNLTFLNDFLYILTSLWVLGSNVFGNKHDQNTIGNTCWPKCIEYYTKIQRNSKLLRLFLTCKHSTSQQALNNVALNKNK